MAHILMVDDERDVARMVSRILEAEGHRVTCTRTGEQALEVLQHESIDLLIVDRALPQLSGEELRTRVRLAKDTARTPILMMTEVYVSLPDASRAIATGVDEFLFKPFMSETLIRNVEHLLGSGETRATRH